MHARMVNILGCTRVDQCISDKKCPANQFCDNVQCICKIKEIEPGNLILVYILGFLGHIIIIYGNTI